MYRIFCWLARFIAIAAIIFLSLFALDAFRPGVPLRLALADFAIHLIPSIVLAGILVVAWRWPLAGGLLFLAASLLPFLLLANAPAVNALLAAPLFLTGVLFVACFVAWHRETRL